MKDTNKEERQKLLKKLGFSKYERICPKHQQDETNVCFCEITESTCNKANCLIVSDRYDSSRFDSSA